MQLVRHAAVAGTFYPGDAAELAHDVKRLLSEAPPSALRPKVLIAPHAGYIYSGPIAASAYAALASQHALIRRVVLLGPVHRVWVQSLALPGADNFETPLGPIPLDREAMQAIRNLPQVEVNPAAHALEHSLEVHLPFLQTVLDNFSLVPLAVGSASAADVAEVLEKLWGGEETLIVISSDLSHYLPYSTAQDIDRETVQHILEFDTNLVGEQACGAHALNGLLLAARRRGLTAKLLDLRNSGETAGDKQQVVGYAAIAMVEPAHAD